MQYLNSVYFLTTPLATHVVSHYDYVMKTDMDVFFTNRFRGWFPVKFQVGVGRYVHYRAEKDRLKTIAHALNLVRF